MTPPLNGISAITYDQIEHSPHDPSIVRYAPQTGRIVAATPARLIAQITSPQFLDYELLSDFFLTYRGFLPPSELLDHLMARLQWALANNSDAGRIVRVRTFVGLRHWILNYFSDDFLTNFDLRCRFCNLVNDMAITLRQRPDCGGSDINIVGELKKCWRRTCTMHWPVENALDTSPDAEVVPGGEEETKPPAASAVSLPLSMQHGLASDSRQNAARGQRPVDTGNTRQQSVQSTSQPPRRSTLANMRSASIPASPMSEHSLDVISCSVPFLRNLQPSSKAAGKQNMARPVELQRNPPISGQPSRPSHQHKRSGSFSDALRDQRAPLPSTKVESVDIMDRPSMTFTGGLVRGLLLQPAPAKVTVLMPISPGLELQGNAQMGSIDQSYFEDKPAQNLGVKRIVGDMRRALSSRKGNNDSAARSHRSAGSNGSRSSGHLTQPSIEKAPQTSAWQQLRGPPRLDMLAANVELSYREAFSHVIPDPSPPPAKEQHEVSSTTRELVPQEETSLRPPPNLDRLNSHVTTGSRSILIVDDTKASEVPSTAGALPSVSSWSSEMTPMALFGKPPEAHEPVTSQNHFSTGVLPSPTEDTTRRRITQDSSPGLPIHELLSVPGGWTTAQMVSGALDQNSLDYFQARKSSSVHASQLGMPQSGPGHQLRRRPGGDLKAADHVHELEPIPRPMSTGSLSTFSRSLTSSQAYSRELSGTHFSRQDFSSQLAALRSPGHAKDSVGLLDTHSSQPNLRPSFEAERLRLARLTGPDTGSVEDALRKLEGKSGAGTAAPSARASYRPEPDMPALTRQEPQYAIAHDSVATDSGDFLSPRTETQGASIYHLSGSDAVSSDPDARDEEEAEDSQSTAPVLPRASKATRFPLGTAESPASSRKSVAFAEKTENIDSMIRGESVEKSDSAPKTPASQGSFLLDDNESLSDISTEIASQPEEDSLGVRSFFFDDTIEEEPSPAPLFQSPPTPPSTVGPYSDPEKRALSQEARRPLKEAQSAPKLLSPTTDKHDFQQQPLNELRRVKTAPSADQTAHLPFVLAFESEVVAEQLTIIEKDALDEIDWKDLIGVSWQQTPPQVRNWVDYLKREETTGIDMVIARFNLVVKWVVSECVLTLAPTERARAFTKFIHIANNCHRMRNYASTYQITMALLSSDVARLQKSWSLVAPAEKQMLTTLEKLCQPIRNFHNLRAEMESSTLEHGCIPFIGLYTHDLMYNAQKPAKIEPTPPSKEPLINFERYQTAATITKSLLRLLEASSRFVFRPHPEVLSRCLWLAALEDVEISARSKALES